MRKYIIIAFAPIFLFITLQSVAQGLLKIENPIRIMSYNVRIDNPGDGTNKWINRQERVSSIIRFHNADIFCLQETLSNQVKDIKNEFPKFEYYGIGSRNGENSGEFCPIFYNKFRFKLIDKGTFWLSETPQVAGSLGKFSNLPRIVSWVKLSDLTLAKEFYVFNTHLDYSNGQSREISSKLIMKKIAEMTTNLPVFLTGDFNERPGSKPYNIIVDTANTVKMFDPTNTATYPHHGPTFTSVGWDFLGIEGNIFDYIFVNSKINVIYHAIIGDNWDGTYPSKHLPVLIEMNFK